MPIRLRVDCAGLLVNKELFLVDADVRGRATLAKEAERGNSRRSGGHGEGHLHPTVHWPTVHWAAQNEGVASWPCESGEPVELAYGVCRGFKEHGRVAEDRVIA